MEVLESQNKKFGFYGTNAVRSRKKAETEWAAAFQWVAEVMPSWTAEDIRNFLDSRGGRHLADESTCVRGGIAKVNPKFWFEEMYAFAVETDIAYKTPDLSIWPQADTAFMHAMLEIQKADTLYQQILNRLPAEKDDTPFTAKLRKHATECKNKIRPLL